MSRVFFSFNYADYQNALIVNNACKFRRAGASICFSDSIWESATKKGNKAMEELVDNAVSHSDVTAFLIGKSTISNKWCRRALQKSIEQKKGVFGIYLPNQMQREKSEFLTQRGYPVHEWESNYLRAWIIAAIQKSLTAAS